MGGDGSGRWGWHRAKTDTDGLLRPDARWPARQGYLDPGTSGAYAVAWPRGDRPAGDILVRYDADRPGELVLASRTRRPAGEPWSPARRQAGRGRRAMEAEGDALADLRADRGTDTYR